MCLIRVRERHGVHRTSEADGRSISRRMWANHSVALSMRSDWIHVLSDGGSCTASSDGAPALGKSKTKNCIPILQTLLLYYPASATSNPSLYCTYTTLHQSGCATRLRPAPCSATSPLRPNQERRTPYTRGRITDERRGAMPSGTRRAHNKTRLGCAQCKRRRIKVITPPHMLLTGPKGERRLQTLVWQW